MKIMREKEEMKINSEVNGMKPLEKEIRCQINKTKIEKTVKVGGKYVLALYSSPRRKMSSVVRKG